MCVKDIFVDIMAWCFFRQEPEDKVGENLCGSSEYIE